MRRSRAKAFAGLIVIALAVACGDASSVIFDVSGVPQSVSLTVDGSTVTVDTLYLNRGQTARLAATVLNAVGGTISGLAVSWTSANPAVATVDSTGLVSAVAAGRTTVSASAAGLVANMPVVVRELAAPRLGRLVLSPDSITLTGTGSTAQLSLTAFDSVDVTINPPGTTWTSTNTAVATVSLTGLVTAVGIGSARIWVANPCCRGDTTHVTVQQEAPGGGGTALLFSSDWSTATGSTDNALRDGGRWANVVCWPVYPQVLQVIPGAQVGWNMTPNVMQVTNRGSQYCGQVNSETNVPQLTSFYIRFYVRVEDENQSNFHPVAVNCCGDIQWTPWSIDVFGAVPGETYHAVMHVPTPQGQPFNSWRPRQRLPMRQWFRFEYYVEYINPTSLRARIWPRVYDFNGTLLYDASSFVSHWDNGANVLAQFYANGGYVQLRNADLARRFSMGYEGTSGATDQGRRWFYAKVELRSDRWPGP
jgi:hypothetical protein